MEKKVVYHGSNVEVSVPRILQNGFYKDFGYGFYCTDYEKQAKRWAMTRKGNKIQLPDTSDCVLYRRCVKNIDI